MALGVQPAGVPEGGVGHPQLRRPGVHLFHEHRLAAAHQLGHCHSGIVGRGNTDGPQHLVQRELLPGLQPDLTAAHVIGVFAHRHGGIEGQFSTADGLKGQQQGHQLGDGSNGHPLIRCFLVEHTACLRFHEDCRPAFQACSPLLAGAAASTAGASACTAGPVPPMASRRPRPPVPYPQPAQTARSRAPPRRAGPNFSVPFLCTSPRKVSGCILCKKRGVNALFYGMKICYNRRVYKHFSWLTLSGRFASSSPKGRAFDKTSNFAWIAKASPFGRGGSASALTERVRPFI